jgi:hypothetical protein
MPWTVLLSTEHFDGSLIDCLRWQTRKCPGGGDLFGPEGQVIDLMDYTTIGDGPRSARRIADQIITDLEEGKIEGEYL